MKSPRQKQTLPPTYKEAAGPVNNVLGRTGFDRDHLYVAKGRSGFPGEATRLEWQPEARGLGMIRPARSKAPFTARYTSPVIKCRFPATELLPSWNIRLHGPDQGFRLFMKMYGVEGTAPSPWLMVGEGGNPALDPNVKVESSAWGKTRIDYLDLKKEAVAFQFRIDLFASDNDLLEKASGPTLCRFYVHYSGQGKAGSRKLAAGVETPLTETKRIKVPFRSQLVEAENIRNLICCPTSLAMILDFYGIRKETGETCDAVYDSRYEIYGVWPRVSQAAFQHGLESYVTRFRSHQDVYQYLESGNPIIASIRVPEGELRGARYPKSNGHIIVIIGYRKNGRYIVNDPASPGKAGAEIDYFAEDIEKVWLDKGGVAILVKPEK